MNDKANDCMNSFNDYVKNQIQIQPDYCFGYKEGEKYIKLRCSDPIRKVAAQRYMSCIESHQQRPT